MREIYISTDIESDGPIPGDHSMLSFGSAAFTKDGKLIGTFSTNLETLPGATMHPSTKQFWDRNPKAWAACREDPIAPDIAMKEYTEWLKSLDGKPVFVAYPAGFDFTFIYWYLIKFTGYCAFSHSALDMKTYAMSIMETEFRKSTKRNMPKSWFKKGLPHTHVAIDDAIEQGYLFCNMLKARKKLNEVKD